MNTLFANRMSVIFTFLGGILVLFIAAPLLKSILATGGDGLWRALQDGDILKSMGLTFYASLIATGIAFALGVPLAYLLSRTDFPGKNIIEGLINIPIVVPHSAAGIALLMVFGRQALVGRFFGMFGIHFVSATPGIIIAMLFVSLSFLVNSARDGFDSVDTHLEKVARTLGASPWQAFWRISFPLAWRSILTGLILMWARGLSEFGAVIILAYHPMVTPVLIYERFESFGLAYARPVAAIVILASLLIFVVLRMIASPPREEA